jgi:hypothetical protein
VTYRGIFLQEFFRAFVCVAVTWKLHSTSLTGRVGMNLVDNLFLFLFFPSGDNRTFSMLPASLLSVVEIQNLENSELQNRMVLWDGKGE